MSAGLSPFLGSPAPPTCDHDGEADLEPGQVAACTHVAQHPDEGGPLGEPEQAIERALDGAANAQVCARQDAARCHACAQTRTDLLRDGRLQQGQRHVQVGVPCAIAVRPPPGLGLHCEGGRWAPAVNERRPGTLPRPCERLCGGSGGMSVVPSSPTSANPAISVGSTSIGAVTYSAHRARDQRQG